MPDGHHLIAGGGAAGAAADAEPGGVANDPHLLDPGRGAALSWCVASISLNLSVVHHRRPEPGSSRTAVRAAWTMRRRYGSFPLSVVLKTL